VSESAPSGQWILFVNFHHVRERNPPQFPHFHHRAPAQLRAQIEALARAMDFPPMCAVERMLATGDMPSRPVGVLTFDDGLRDHVEVVAPLLESLDMSAAFFINTAPWVTGHLLSVHMAHFLSAAFSYVELSDDIVAVAHTCGARVGLEDVPRETAVAQYRFDDAATAVVKYFLNAVIPQHQREDVLRRVFEARLGDDRPLAKRHYLDRDDARALVQSKHVVGMHSHEHLHLAATSREARRADLATNRELIADATGLAPRWLSYPYGSPSSYDDSVVDDVRELGCSFALTLAHGVNRAPIDLLRLRRVDTNDAVGGKSERTWKDFT
jgi:peptidoglycan/xylan/chitin deacetylase (PgdA/CDA1 family)